MYYKEWANEYYLQIDLLKEKLEKLKLQRKRTKTVLEKKQIEDRIYILYGMYLDCLHTAGILEERAHNCEVTKAG